MPENTIYRLLNFLRGTVKIFTGNFALHPGIDKKKKEELPVSSPTRNR
jgi:hypothetical protein